MFEVYTGHKPGRPLLLLIVSVAALTGTLGAAWLQVQNRRALGPEVRIDGTPLIVRAPRGWVRERDDPSSFVLPAQYTAWGRELLVAKRELRFRYNRLAAFRSPAYGIAAQIGGRLDPNRLTPARIGPFDGLQYVLPGQQRRNARLSGDVIIRCACSPRGDQITVLYLPLTELTHADLGLLDDVCAAVRLDDPAIRPRAADALHQAGLAFSLPSSWTVSGPDVPDVAGLHLGGAVDGEPAWALDVLRTVLAYSRTPRELLLDFALTEWNLAEDELRIVETGRADGAEITTIHPAREESLPIPVAAALLHRGATAALIAARGAEPRFAAEMNEALRRFAAGAELTPTAALPDVEQAIAAGGRLAARLTGPGVFSGAWGMLPEQHVYLVEGGADEGVFAIGRAARNRRPQEGYFGYMVQLSRDMRVVLTWRQEADGVTYEWERSAPDGPGPSAAEVRLRETRRAAESSVTRTRRLGRNTARSTHEFGPAFVGLPAEELAESWVAAQTEPREACLIQVSGTRTSGLHTRWLRPLAADENGRRRVLLQDDFDVAPAVLVFDADGLLDSVVQPGWRARRISDAEAFERFPVLREMIRLAFN